MGTCSAKSAMMNCFILRVIIGIICICSMEFSVLSSAFSAVSGLGEKEISSNTLKLCMRGSLFMSVMFVTNDFIRNQIGNVTVLFIRMRNRINVIYVEGDLIIRVLNHPT